MQCKSIIIVTGPCDRGLFIPEPRRNMNKNVVREGVGRQLRKIPAWSRVFRHHVHGKQRPSSRENQTSLTSGKHNLEASILMPPSTLASRHGPSSLDFRARRKRLNPLPLAPTGMVLLCRWPRMRARLLAIYFYHVTYIWPYLRNIFCRFHHVRRKAVQLKVGG